MRKALNFLLLSFYFLIQSTDGANILFLNAVASPSHHVFNRALAIGLGARGHNLTVVSPDVDQKDPLNVHYIHLEEVYSYTYNRSEHIDLIGMTDESTLQSIVSFQDFTFSMCEGIAISKGIQKIRNYPDDFKFDLVIFDFTSGPCLLGLLPKFKYPPLIGVSAFNIPPYTYDIIGGDKLGLTTSPFYLLYYDMNMNIFQRIHNGIIHFIDSIYRKYYVIPEIDKQMKRIFGSQIPYAGDLEKMSNLMLVNSNPIIGNAESLPPNVIQVGGMQISDAKPIPDEVDQFLKKGKKGAILMALGTNLRSDQLGDKKIKMILEAFRQFPDYNFLWKFETSELIDSLPSNVMIRAWLPQSDILAHSNLKLFISHSGLLSSQEAYWWGVPIVGIPLFADQHQNLHKSVTAGVAVKVDFQTLSTDMLKKAINEVLSNPKYRENIKQKSKLFRDQPEKPLERAIWWCEYIMRNPKPDHLKAAEFNFGLLGSHFWDIQILLLIVVILLFCTIKKLIRKSKPTNFVDKNRKTK